MDNVTVWNLCLLVFVVFIKVHPGIFFIYCLNYNTVVTVERERVKEKAVRVKGRVKEKAVRAKVKAKVKLITSHQVAFLKPHTSDSFDFVFID